MVESKGKIYEFNGFRLEAAERRLTKNGEPVTLPSKAFDVLHTLVENSGHLITKEDLYQQVWAGTIVEDANLTVQIAAIRRALGAPDLIDTVKGHGYRFAADVHEVNGHGDDVLLESRTFSRVTVEHETVHPRRFRQAYLFAGVLFCLAAVGVAGVYYFSRGLVRETAEGPTRFTKLTSNGKVTNMAVSADGKFVIFSQKEDDGESLWLRQIESGSQTRIVPPRPLDYVGLAITPDGNFVYASLFEMNRSDVSLVKIPVLGGAEQIIPSVSTGASVSFSPDGKFFAYTEGHLPETHLKIAAGDGTDQRVVAKGRDAERSFTFFQANPVAWSPDGETIAVAVDVRNEGGTRAGIMLVDPSDGSEKGLVEPRWAFIENIAWTGGDSVAFIAYDNEWANQVWIASRSTGAVRQVTNDLQNYKWLGSTAKGLVTVQSNVVASIRTADFDATADSLNSREIFSESSNIPNVVWGRNGEIFYNSMATGKHEIWRMENEQATPSLLTAGAEIVYGLAVSPRDGGFVFGSFRDGKYSIGAADADGRNLRSLTGGPGDTYPDVSSHGDVLFQRGINNQEISVWHLAADAGKQVKIGDRGLKPIFSPDGQQVAYFAMEDGKWRIVLKSIGLEDRPKKIDLPITVNQRRMRWHPSGKFLTIVSNAGENLDLMLLPIDEGKSSIIGGLGKGDLSSFSWSANGSRLLYSVAMQSRDVVMLHE